MGIGKRLLAHMRKLALLFLALAFMLSGALAARAQGSAYAELLQPDASDFPTISALMDVYDAQGQFVSGLNPTDVTIMEDGQPRQPDEVKEMRVGVQFVVAVNPGPPMAVRDSSGASRYEKVVQALQAWGESRPADSPDDMSLATTVGPLLSHDTTASWLVNFSAFQPDPRAMVPSLQSLSFAIDLAAASTPGPGMKRVVLFLTPHMEQGTFDVIDSLAAKAALSKVRVYVWLIDSQAYFDHSSVTAFQDLTQRTGGSLFTYSGYGSLPDPEKFLSPLRHVYSLKYSSQLAESGNHALIAQVKTSADSLESPQVSFDLNVQPPNPILVSPPFQILRQTPPDDRFNLDALGPNEQTVEMLVEFPDGHKRALKRTALYVDGVQIAENTSEPFDKFTWDLSGYNSSGQHSLQVFAEDELGLSKTSLSLPVTVTVVLPPGGLVALLAKNSTFLTAAAIALAGLVLGLILVSGGWLRAGLTRWWYSRKVYEDPVTQPVQIRQDAGTRERSSLTRLPWVGRPRVPSAPAYLIRLTAEGQPATANPIPLMGSEMTFGTDPVQASYVLDDPSISPLHARLRQTREGDFVLADQNSVAGTWVNYDAIGREGQTLQHGDVVNFGNLHFRFTLQKAPKQPAPRVETEEAAK
jgi:hypothetical protein